MRMLIDQIREAIDQAELPASWSDDHGSADMVIRTCAAHREILDAYAQYRSKLDGKPEDEEQRWHTIGQGSVWHRVITALARIYQIEITA